MRNLDKALAWLKRAKSNLARAKVGKVSEDILYEDFCRYCNIESLPFQDSLL